jgi:hypothetical protein
MSETEPDIVPLTSKPPREQAIAALVKMLESGNLNIRLEAAKILLDKTPG